MERLVSVALAVVLGVALPACHRKREKAQSDRGEKGHHKPDPAVLAELQGALQGEPAGASDKKARKIDVPVPINEKVKGFVFPYYDLDGLLRMRFTAEEGKRLDEDHFQMALLKVETFDEAGDPDLLIDLPKAVLNLSTQVIFSRDPVTIRRSDFELTGAAMEYHTDTRNGRLHGKVRMLIFDRSKMTKDQSKETKEAKKSK